MHYFFFILLSPPFFPRRRKRAGSPVSSFVPVLQGKGDMPKLISGFQSNKHTFALCNSF